MQLTSSADPPAIARDLRRELEAIAPELRWGAIRLAHVGRAHVSSLSSAVDLPGDLGGTQVARAGKLLTTWVPDANGVQILNGDHLSALELSDARWAITDLGGDRFLVQARDLGPWLGGQSVPASVLAQAREDFRPVQTADLLLEARRREPLI